MARPHDKGSFLPFDWREKTIVQPGYTPLRVPPPRRSVKLSLQIYTLSYVALYTYAVSVCSTV